MDIPEIHYALSGDVHVAYRVWGDGPYDIVVVPPLLFSILLHGAEPDTMAGFERMSSYARVITFDKRGTGASDPVAGAPSLEERMDDVRAVMDATGSSCAALLGVADGGAMSILFAATYPERIFGLGLFRAKPRYVWALDFPWAPTREAYEQGTEKLRLEAVDHSGRLISRPAYPRRLGRVVNFRSRAGDAFMRRSLPLRAPLASNWHPAPVVRAMIGPRTHLWRAVRHGWNWPLCRYS